MSSYETFECRPSVKLSKRDRNRVYDVLGMTSLFSSASSRPSKADVWWDRFWYSGYAAFFFGLLLGALTVVMPVTPVMIASAGFLSAAWGGFFTRYRVKVINQVHDMLDAEDVVPVGWHADQLKVLSASKKAVAAFSSDSISADVQRDRNVLAYKIALTLADLDRLSQMPHRTSLADAANESRLESIAECEKTLESLVAALSALTDRVLVASSMDATSPSARAAANIAAVRARTLALREPDPDALACELLDAFTDAYTD